ncbi:MAG: Zn-ribbon domain-containing OB-fold protein [Candidatus Hermodarchaeota archaeon]|nr:Zn-ribbon domain-containing OB-fold protein [Candidatus Hermodarchaeota archaeon]
MSFDKIRDPRKLRHQIGDMECDYIYTAGIAGERFYIALRDEGKLLATHCKKCNHTFMPPRMYCDLCFGELTEYKQVPPRGIIESYTITYDSRDGEPLAEPLVLAFIKIDETDGGLIHTVSQIQPHSLKIGTKVEAVFEDKAKRKGALTDIRYFKPI